MGGAAVWQFGAHYTDRWCAINPGAGFSETPQFLNVFQSEDVSKIPAYQQTLWSWYNATDVAANFANAPLVAYSGEIDKQKQAADLRKGVEAEVRAEVEQQALHGEPLQVGFRAIDARLGHVGQAADVRA